MHQEYLTIINETHTAQICTQINRVLHTLVAFK